MKHVFFYFIVAILFVSCKNSDENSTDDMEMQDLENQEFPNNSGENSEDTNWNNNQTSNNSSPNSGENGENSSPNNRSKPQQNTAVISTGSFIKVGEEKDASCACYCLEINFNTNSELCLLKDELYINARFEKANNGNINVYYVSPSDVNTTDKKLPWDKFDTTAPVATITPKSNNLMELDWLGFQIDGKIAVEYALYGKKTLEGDFKKQ